MRRSYLLVALFSAAATQAGEYNPGSGMTTGPVSSGQSIFAARHNPALASFAIAPHEH